MERCGEGGGEGFSLVAGGDELLCWDESIVYY